ncbi:unnamed protein product [Phytomonas sp. Hart1]|nr:unnamed protein product [Phytomonas sp. Hart1]|eukprot:CCW66032.1 unnamed protein product [Phytomonas sp. isolate Hart1]
MTAVKNSNTHDRSTAGELWSDKYKPQCISEMCYTVFANKLLSWLKNFDSAGEGASKKTRAVLLSGPPGVGKTTTVYVVAREAGLSVIEYNASDFRSSKSLREHVSTLITNRAFSKSGTSYTNVLLLMDEVDGCDVGGVGEVIEFIKTTQIPIVCTCNDRWHPKLRSLVNHVEDLRFTRPPCNIVANYIYDRILAREQISLSKALLQDIIKRSGSDIRSMLNNLQMWCLRRRVLNERELATYAVKMQKDNDTSIFDNAEYFLLQGTSRGEVHTIHEMALRFYNADLVDLFVQENYLHFSPSEEGWLPAVARAAESISRADRAQRMMYGEQNWTVSRAHALFSSIAPCVYTRGKYNSFLDGPSVFFDRQRPVKFPTWLGHYSTLGKHRRLLRCLTTQAQGGISGNQEDVLLDYIPLGWERGLLQPLAEFQKDGIPQLIAFMDTYKLMRDDVDFVQGAAHFKRMRGASRSGCDDLARRIPTAVKSAFTRDFNRTHRVGSFAKAALRHIDKGGAGTLSNDSSDDDEKAEGLGEGVVVGDKKKPSKAVKDNKKTTLTTKRKITAAAEKKASASTNRTSRKKAEPKRRVKKARKNISSDEDSFIESDSDGDE